MIDSQNSKSHAFCLTLNLIDDRSLPNWVPKGSKQIFLQLTLFDLIPRVPPSPLYIYSPAVPFDWLHISFKIYTWV
ncbi:hypothetical protein CW304_09240 [Bacillus sp. UFRGS-B20]|nr:hypothetical protein CW304_09240 [Bacillus sp. UFRGS-B20]